jgi:hypothetical protein
VVKIVDESGKVSFEAIESKELEKRKKAADDAYAKAERAWQEAVKTDPSTPKPVRVTFSVIQSGITGSDAKAKAEAAAARCKEEFEKKQKEAAEAAKP